MEKEKTDLASLLARLQAAEVAVASSLSGASETLAELRREANAAHKRKRRHVERYSWGGVLLDAGFAGLDALAVAGLLTHPGLALKWLVETQIANGSSTLGELFRQALNEPGRLEWCRAWGAHLAWRRRARLYKAEVRSFLESGRTGPRERWRREVVSVGQDWLIDLVCEIRRIGRPTLRTRGEAFDWLLAVGGDPRFAEPPAQPEHWS